MTITITTTNNNNNNNDNNNNKNNHTNCNNDGFDEMPWETAPFGHSVKSYGRFSHLHNQTFLTECTERKLGRMKGCVWHLWVARD